MLWLRRWEFTRTGDLFNRTIYVQVGLQKSQYVWRLNLISHLQRRVQESPFLQKGGKWVVLTWLLRLWGVPHCVCVFGLLRCGRKSLINRCLRLKGHSKSIQGCSESSPLSCDETLLPWWEWSLPASVLHVRVRWMVGLTHARLRLVVSCDGRR